MNYHLKKDLKLIFFIFSFCFIIFSIILNSSLFTTVIPYKIERIINSFHEEVQKPPSFTLDTKDTKKITNTNKLSVVIPRDIEAQAENQNIIYLPKFNIVAPLQTVNSNNLKTIYAALRKGTVIYPTTDLPGNGYTIILGHSSQYPWEPGRYKSVFSLLSELDQGDLVIIYWNKQKLIFEVTDKKIFLPWPKGNEITETIFPPQSNQKIVILQSCWPVGVAYKRVAVKTVLVNNK
jgi:sortase (surface protein transpeptidase)